MDTNKLKNQIATLDQIVDWVGSNLQGNEKTEYFKYLIERRRMMKRIHHSLTVNPTIAAYGESQKGKSYIIASMLRRAGDNKEVMIRDENGKELDFIENFNLKTKNQESTGVITRFTTESVSSDSKHPIKLRIMSLADVITFLADGYMNAVKGYTSYQIVDLQQKGQEQVKHYMDKPKVQNQLIEDDVYDICDYLLQSNKTAANVFKESQWFDYMAMIVQKIPLSDIAKEFSYLWFEDPTFTKLLEIIINNLIKIDFQKELYIDTKPVLNYSEDNSYTLMSVVALTDEKTGIQSFYDSEGRNSVMVTVKLLSGNTIEIAKPLLSLLTFEVVYHVEEDTLKNDISFFMEGVRESPGHSADDNRQFLRQNGFDKPTNRSFLYRENGSKNDTCFDLLDFPGARTIVEIQSNNVPNELANLLLREKVLFMFQKYTYEKLISILLICHDHENNATGGAISEQLNKWIMLSVGSDVQKRTRNIANYKLSPLFIISTKYNCDLVVAKGNSDEWKVDKNVFHQRLILRLSNEVILPKSHDWFDHWTEDGKFDNTFLLRDFKYSSNNSEINGRSELFEGYPGKEVKELHATERQQIKELFLREECVHQFFKKPELAWDAASTMQNDGSYYLFKKLNLVTPNVQNARSKDLGEEFDNYVREIIEKVTPKFHTNNPAEDIKDSIMKVRRLSFVMPRMLEQHEDFFGKFIQHLQLTSNYTTKFVTNMVHDVKINDTINNGQYEMLLDGVEQMGYQFKKGDKKANMEILREVFGINGENDPLLEGIDLDELFNPNPKYKNKLSPSYVIVSSLIEEWLKNIVAPENNLYFGQIQFSSAEVSEFYNRFKGMIEHIHLVEKIASAIRDYADFTPTISQKSIPLIADIITNMFNGYVMDMGYSYLSEEDMVNVRRTNDMYKLRLSFNYELNEMTTDQDNTELDADVRRQLFESLEALGNGEHGQQLSLPAYSGMKKWLEFATIAYIANYATQDWGYTPEENDRLGVLIQEIK